MCRFGPRSWFKQFLLLPPTLLQLLRRYGRIKQRLCTYTVHPFQVLKTVHVPLSDLLNDAGFATRTLVSVLQNHVVPSQPTWVSVLAAAVKSRECMASSQQHVISERVPPALMAALSLLLSWLSSVPVPCLVGAHTGLQQCAATLASSTLDDTCLAAPKQLCSAGSLRELMAVMCPPSLRLSAAAATARNQARYYLRAWSDIAVSAAGALIILAPVLQCPCLSASCALLNTVQVLHSTVLSHPAPPKAHVKAVHKTPKEPAPHFHGSFKPPSLLDQAPMWAHHTAAQLQHARHVSATSALTKACASNNSQEALQTLIRVQGWISPELPPSKPAVPTLSGTSSAPVQMWQLRQTLSQLQKHFNAEPAEDVNHEAQTSPKRARVLGMGSSQYTAAQAVAACVLSPALEHTRALGDEGRVGDARTFAAECITELVSSANAVLPSLPSVAVVPLRHLQWAHATLHSASTLASSADGARTGVDSELMTSDTLQSSIWGVLLAWEYLLLLQVCAVESTELASDIAALTLVQPKRLLRSCGFQYLLRQLEGWDRVPHAVLQLFTLLAPVRERALQSGESAPVYAFPPAAVATGVFQWAAQQLAVCCSMASPSCAAVAGTLGELLALFHGQLARSCTAAAGMVGLLRGSDCVSSLYRLIPAASRSAIEGRGLASARGARDKEYTVRSAAAGDDATASGPTSSGISAKQRMKHAHALLDVLDLGARQQLHALRAAVLCMDDGLLQLSGQPHLGAVTELMTALLLCADSIAAVVSPAAPDAPVLHGCLPQHWEGCLSSARCMRLTAMQGDMPSEVPFSLWQVWTSAVAAVHTSGGDGTAWLPPWLQQLACRALKPLCAEGMLPNGLLATQTEQSPSVAAAPSVSPRSWQDLSAAAPCTVDSTVPHGLAWETWESAWRNCPLLPEVSDVVTGAKLALHSQQLAHAAVLLSMSNDSSLHSTSLSCAVMAVEAHMRLAVTQAESAAEQAAVHAGVLGQVAHDGILESVLLHARSAACDRCAAQLAEGGLEVDADTAAQLRRAGAHIATLTLGAARRYKPLPADAHPLQVRLARLLS